MPYTRTTAPRLERLHLAPSSATTCSMAGTNKKLTAAVDAYFAELGRMHASGGATGERSSYGPLHAFGERTFDIYVNRAAVWCNVPAAVWNYRLGGYQVLEKWMSYRERTVLGRPVLDDEIHHYMNAARRIAAILLLTTTGFGRPVYAES